nr:MULTISPECIES: transposase [unclassified Streptomyces]
MFARVAGRFARADLRRRERDYVRGLASVERKNGLQLAEWAGHRDPAGLQHLLNGACWDAEAVRDDVRDYVAERLGPDAVLIIDDIGFIKKGTTSAGVGRQYTGISGKIDNCQIGVFAAYVTTSGRALVDRELYLPITRTSDRERCRRSEMSGALRPRVNWPGNNSASATSSPCPSPSRSSPWPESGASMSSSAKHPVTPGSGCPAATGPRGRASTTGPRPNCPPT